MTKNAAVIFGYHCHCFRYFSAIIILSKIVAVIAKDDCRVFCHINSLGDKISNTAALIQPNPFWFWEKYHSFFHVFPQIASILVCKGPKEQVCRGKCSQWPHSYTTYEAKYDLK